MLDVEGLIAGVSVIGALSIIGIIVFAESGLLIGLFLPGDTLLFTAGFFAAQGELPIGWVIVVITVAAVLGDNVGYYFGEKTGQRIFQKKEGVFFRKEYVERATVFYDKHGGKTVMFARFVPYVRTFAPIIAGAAKMNHFKFFIYNIAGAFTWTVTFVLFGYWFGVELAEEIEQYIVPAFIFGLLFAFSPTIIYFIRNPRFRAAVIHRFAKIGHLFRRKRG
jgi:membrane-associated protein